MLFQYNNFYMIAILQTSLKRSLTRISNTEWKIGVLGKGMLSLSPSSLSNSSRVLEVASLGNSFHITDTVQLLNLLVDVA